MKLLSVKTVQPDGSYYTAAVKITDNVASDEKQLQTALDAVIGGSGNSIESYQIIDTDAETVKEVTGDPSQDIDMTDDAPQVGVQHDDAVGIIDGQGSGADPVDAEPYREDMGTVTDPNPDSFADMTDEAPSAEEEAETVKKRKKS